MLWKNVSHLIFIIALQWPTLSQFVLSLISPVSRLLPKFVVTAEELREQLRRGGWNKALVLLSESCLRQSDRFWQSFPNQQSALSFDVWTFGLFSRAPHSPWVAARRSRELRWDALFSFLLCIKMVLGDSSPSGRKPWKLWIFSMRCITNCADSQPCLSSLTWAIKYLFSSPPQLN